MACDDPPSPPAESDLRLSWDGKQVTFDQTVYYVCKYYGRYGVDGSEYAYELECNRTREDWLVPEWPTCVRSKMSSAHSWNCLSSLTSNSNRESLHGPST